MATVDLSPELAAKAHALLLAQIARTSGGKVAEALGVSRAAISLIKGGNYAGRPDRIYQRVLDKWSTLTCPFLRKEIGCEECHTYAKRDFPSHAPSTLAMHHWRACQVCEFKPR